VDSTGAPVGGWEVFAVPEPPSPVPSIPLSTVTAPDGSFSVTGLLSGRYTVYLPAFPVTEADATGTWSTTIHGVHAVSSKVTRVPDIKIR
jgi:hypothetical protein